MTNTTTTAEVDRARRHSLGDLLHRSAQRFPDKTAVVYRDRRATFSEFDTAVNRCANALIARGLSTGSRVALLAHNSWQFAVLELATARAGVILVPINFMLTPVEVAYILDHSGADALLVEDSLLPIGQEALELAGRELRVRAVITDDDGPLTDGWEQVDDWWSTGVDQPPDVAVEDDDPVRLMYTSGTESRPKGVLLSSRSLISQYVSCIVGGQMSSDDVELHALPMYHCAQLDAFFNVDVYLGATSVILSGADPTTILQTIERERITKFFCPPTVWISLLRHPGFDSTDLSSLAKGYYGASAMPVEVLHELRRRLPQMSLWNFYGQTELSPVATILGPEDQVDRAGSAGRAALNVETRIVDDDDRDVPPGEIGEIVHRSPHAALGYLQDPDKTAEAFHGGWFHSGDLGTIDADGYLTVVDRKKDMIKTGGENVASREVEEAIYTLDGVAEVAVFGIAHPRWIEAVTAAVVPREGYDLTPDEVIAHTRHVLAQYKQPKHVIIVDGLPKNPSGKILKRDLRDRYADPVD